MQSELLSSEHKWSSKGATNTIVLASDQSCETIDRINLEKFTVPTKMNLFVNRNQFNKQLQQQVRIAGKLACAGRHAISPLILSPNAISCYVFVITVIITAIHNKHLNCTLDINIHDMI